MAVIRQPTNAERVQAAQQFLYLYEHVNPFGVLFFWTIMERWHQQFCQNPLCPNRKDAD